MVAMTLCLECALIVPNLLRSMIIAHPRLRPMILDQLTHMRSLLSLSVLDARCSPVIAESRLQLILDLDTLFFSQYIDRDFSSTKTSFSLFCVTGFLLVVECFAVGK